MVKSRTPIDVSTATKDHLVNASTRARFRIVLGGE